MPKCVIKKCRNNTLTTKKKGGVTDHCTLLILCQVVQTSYGQMFKHYTTGVYPAYNVPWVERYHDPRQDFYYQERVVNNTQMPGPVETPDFRVEEDTWYRYYSSRYNRYTYVEFERPFRISPAEKQLYLWEYYRKSDQPRALGCYCTTVYKRYILLAGGAVLTRRHILTTASSTELVLKTYRGSNHLEGILGAWYDIDDHTSWNSSVYMTPSRIHYHPNYLRVDKVNHTHPLPFLYDLAVWTSTYDFYLARIPRAYGWVSGFYFPKAYLCERGAAHGFQYLSSTPRWMDIAIVVGFQFMKASRRRPMPWFKYAVKTRDHYYICPKTEWAWFHCLNARLWGKYGIESGAAWHRSLENRYWLYNGLIGLNAFSLRLRSPEIVHYFTVLNTHNVLDFLYDAYMGRLPYEYLDQRFWNTQWYAPVAKAGYYIDDPSWGYNRNIKSFEGVYEMPLY